MENWAVPVIVSIAAVLLDHLVGEPRRWHPLVGFGNLVVRMERLLNRQPDQPARSFWAGGLGVLILCVPL